MSTRQRNRDAMRINPNPRLIWLLNYAIDEIMARLHRKDEYRDWLSWAVDWKKGERRPQRCVDISHRCFDHKGWGIDGNGTDPVWHALGQLAWSAKEACYDVPQTGWLVVRYIADAMIAFGISYPKEMGIILEPSTIRHADVLLELANK